MSAILEHGTLIIALLNFAVTIAAGSISVYVKFALAEMKAELGQQISSASEEIDERVDRLRRETGETALAIRAKIGEVEHKVFEVELYVRDTYVRHETISKIDERLERMEGKIDQIRGGAWK